MQANKIRDAYRKAAVKLFDISEAEASVYIRAPQDDPGEWAPTAKAIIYLEADCRTDDDTGTLPAMLDSYTNDGMDRCSDLDKASGTGCYIEYINAAVAAVWS